jgi:hypothetical protein
VSDDRRRLLLRVALSFLELPARAPELRLLHRWLETWTGIGLIAFGVERCGLNQTTRHAVCPNPGPGGVAWLRRSRIPTMAPNRASPISQRRRNSGSRRSSHPRSEGTDQDDAVPQEALTIPGHQDSAGKTGTRSDARKRVSANRGGKAPGKARAKAGASGRANRRPANTVRAKRGTTPAA